MFSRKLLLAASLAVVAIFPSFAAGSEGWTSKDLIINYDITPRYQDNLKAFIDLHENLKSKEDEVINLLGTAALEMGGIKNVGSTYSCFEQVLEKKLNDKSHYGQLGVALVNTVHLVTKVGNDFVDYASFMKQRIAEEPKTFQIWETTNISIGKQIKHVSTLVTSLGIDALVSARSSAEEKENLLMELKKSILAIQSTINTGKHLATYFVSFD